MHRQKTHRQIFKMIYGTLVMESGTVLAADARFCPHCGQSLYLKAFVG